MLEKNLHLVVAPVTNHALQRLYLAVHPSMHANRAVIKTIQAMKRAVKRSISIENAVAMMM